jgi:hypothetical protein
VSDVSNCGPARQPERNDAADARVAFSTVKGRRTVTKLRLIRSCPSREVAGIARAAPAIEGAGDASLDRPR